MEEEKGTRDVNKRQYQLPKIFLLAAATPAWSRAPALCRPVGEPDDEAEAGPGVSDRAHLVVHEARLQSHGAQRSPVRSVATPDALFGQATQSPLDGESRPTSSPKRLARRSWLGAKNRITSRGELPRGRVTQTTSAGRSPRTNPGGASMTAMRGLGLMPSLRASGVPEYPGMGKALASVRLGESVRRLGAGKRLRDKGRPGRGGRVWAIRPGSSRNTHKIRYRTLPGRRAPDRHPSPRNDKV